MGAGIRFGGICPRQACPANNMRKEEKDMFCTKCGNQIPDGSAVCPICGAQLAAPQPAPQPAPQAAPVAPVAPAQKSKKVGGSKLPIIIGAAAAVVVLVVVLVLLLSGGPKSVVKKYIKKELAAQEEQAKAEEKLLGDYYDIVEDMNDLTLLKNKSAKKKLKLDKEKEEKEVEMTWEITDYEKFGDGDKAFQGLVRKLELEDGATIKSISKIAIVEVKWFDKNDKKNDDNTTYQYYTCVKLSGTWYFYQRTSKMKGDAENAKIQKQANVLAEYLEMDWNKDYNSWVPKSGK